MYNYLDVVYGKKPFTDYPAQLCKYLFDRYGMKVRDTLLDVGAGRGEFTDGFNKVGLNTVGIEKSDPYIGDSQFNIVFSKSVIEHVEKQDIFVQKIYRVLKPGGRVIMMTPDWHSQMFLFYNDPTHVRPYTVKGIEDLLSMGGFKEVKAELFYQLPILWKYPWLKVVSKTLQLLGPPKKIHKNKFYRWSRELMILASGIK